MPQSDLLRYLEGIGDGKIGMDCSIVPLKHPGLSMISTTDFFYPLVDDPYMQGKIGCSNVLSDLYAMGIPDCDNMLMILAASVDMTKVERDIVTKLLIKGFHDQAISAGTIVTGGQTVLNPWPIIGGTATSVCTQDEFIVPENAVVGDVIVLTKPLGTQVAVNVSQWRYIEEKWNMRIGDMMTKEEANRAYQYAMHSMSRLNRNGAKLMRKYGAHAATDVTGFGIFGHGNNLARNQKNAVQFIIHTLPIIKHMREVDEKNQLWNLTKGMSAETSGGLFICLPRDKAELFCKELESLDNSPAWIIGDVIQSDKDRSLNNCKIIDNPTYLSI